MKINLSNNENDNHILCRTELSSQWGRQGMVSMSSNKETSPAQCYHKVKWAHCELMTLLIYLMY